MGCQGALSFNNMTHLGSCAICLVSFSDNGRLLGGFTYLADSFSPKIDAIRSIRKNILQKSEGSLNSAIPTIVEPAAPIPVQTA